MSPEQCERSSKRWARADVARLHRALVRGADLPGWDPGKALEYLVVRAFELDGLQVRRPFTVSVGTGTSEQIDGAVVLRSTKFLIEAKAGASAPVDFTPIGKLHAQLSRRPPATMGIVVALHGFTPAAIELANMTGPRVLLWHKHDLELALSRRGRMKRVLELKYDHAEEHGLADYSGDQLEVVLR